MGVKKLAKQKIKRFIWNSALWAEYIKKYKEKYKKNAHINTRKYKRQIHREILEEIVEVENEKVYLKLRTVSRIHNGRNWIQGLPIEHCKLISI